MGERTLTDLMKARLKPEYWGELHDADGLKEHLDWHDRGEKTFCCDEPVEVEVFICEPVFAECKVCGKMAINVTGPEYTSSGVALPSDEYDLSDNKRWLAIGIDQ